MKRKKYNLIRKIPFLGLLCLYKTGNNEMPVHGLPGTDKKMDVFFDYIKNHPDEVLTYNKATELLNKNYPS